MYFTIAMYAFINFENKLSVLVINKFMILYTAI